MNSSFRTRLEALEAKIAPKGRHLVFVHFQMRSPPHPGTSSVRHSRLSTASPPATILSRTAVAPAGLVALLAIAVLYVLLQRYG